MKYLDETGLAHLWDKITNKFSEYIPTMISNPQDSAGAYTDDEGIRVGAGSGPDANVYFSLGVDGNANIDTTGEFKYNGVKVATMNDIGGGSVAWTELGHKTGTSAFNISTSGYSEIMVFAETSRNSAYHYFSAVMPVERLRSALYELKLGGGVGASITGASAMCNVKVSKTQAQLAANYIAGTSYASATTVYVYGR